MDRETIEERFPVGSRWRAKHSHSFIRTVIARAEDGVVNTAEGGYFYPGTLEAHFERIDTPAPASKPEPVVRVGQVWRHYSAPVDYRVDEIRDGYAWGARRDHHHPAWEPLGPRLFPVVGHKHTLVTDAPPQPVERLACCQCGRPVEPERVEWATPVCFACLPPPKPLPVRPAPKATQPAVMCEYPDALGRQHALTTTTYDCCAVCGASASDRRAARRRVFDADVETHEHQHVTCAEHCMRYVAALKSGGPASPAMPTREAATEQLWQKLEAKREAGRG